MSTKLTTNSEETFIQNLLGKDIYFSIPLFQREYKWTKKVLSEFTTDIEQLVERDETHFMGAVILSETLTSPANMMLLTDNRGLPHYIC